MKGPNYKPQNTIMERKLSFVTRWKIEQTGPNRFDVIVPQGTPGLHVKVEDPHKTLTDREHDELVDKLNDQLIRETVILK